MKHDYHSQFNDWLHTLGANMTQYDQVREFRTKLGLPVSDVPALLPPEQLSFYARFIMEELSELMKAHEKGDLVDAADAVVDLLYVTMGLSHHLGLPLEDLFQVVHKANMTKEPGMTKRGIGQDATKPANWVPPEAAIAAILYRNRK
jgi:predicted HAD superfamily Cof-like phosphohydrolase